MRLVVVHISKVSNDVTHQVLKVTNEWGWILYKIYLIFVYYIIFNNLKFIKMEIEECLKEWEDLVVDYKRLEVSLVLYVFRFFFKLSPQDFCKLIISCKRSQRIKYS